MNVQNSFHSHSSFYFTNVNVNVQNSFHLPYDPNSWWCNVNVNVNVKKTLPKHIIQTLILLIVTLDVLLGRITLSIKNPVAIVNIAPN